jgi:hypothetical protein
MSICPVSVTAVVPTCRCIHPGFHALSNPRALTRFRMSSTSCLHSVADSAGVAGRYPLRESDH